MDAEPYLPAHLDYLQLRNQRPRSIRERRLAVMRTNRRLGKPVADATTDDLKAWQSTIARLTPAGQHNEIVHTTCYIHWAIDTGLRDDDPTRVIVRPRNVHRSLPHPISDADLGVALLTAPQPIRAWIALAGFCGLRCMEIAGLTRRDVRDNHVPPVLEVCGKGGKLRVVPLPARVLAELHDAGMPSRGYLYSRLDGQAGPPSAMRVSERINDHLHSLGIADTAHKLRHRFGTVLYRETRDPFLVARVMGHESTDTTKGYVLVDPFEAAPHVEVISRLAGEAPGTQAVRPRRTDP